LLKEFSLAAIHDTEGLMVLIINHLADKFATNAILKGGMELRLLDCPRFTNDLDYVFVPYSSKKTIKDLIYNALKEIPNCDVSYSVNSKCIRYLVIHETIRVQIEINVALECKSQELTTSSLARPKNQPIKIIRVMELSCALAHKLAAWNERGLVRDLFDAYYLAVILQVTPDKDVLLHRLGRIENRHGSGKKASMSLSVFIEKLKAESTRLNQKIIENELRDYLTISELPGLDKKIIGGILKIIELLQ
jgi:predicted nucleotidyltransferase component of viral defense system